MSADCSVHAVYGVHLEDDDHDRLDAAVRAWIDETCAQHQAGVMEPDDAEAWEGHSAADMVQEAFDEAPAVRDLVQELRQKHGLPPAAEVYHTGDEDDRPGRCDVAADRYVIGWGMLAFPAAVVPVACRSACEWHTWVESL